MYILFRDPWKQQGQHPLTSQLKRKASMFVFSFPRLKEKNGERWGSKPDQWGGARTGQPTAPQVYPRLFMMKLNLYL